jgi:chromosome segregation ATPase
LVRILSYGKDPQIYLPPFPEGKFDGPLRLEVWLKTETGREPIRRGISELATISAKAVATTSETQTLLEQSNRAVSDKEAEMEALRLAREAGREREAALGEMVDSLKEQLASLKSELAAKTGQLAETKKQAKQAEQVR